MKHFLREFQNEQVNSYSVESNLRKLVIGRVSDEFLKAFI